ncbi:Serine/threonine-protein phosphatase 5 [Nymphon striatum]|nr:Serine/threonine-protein phosphatase 5 [Nymphon striatum]
MVFLNFPKLFNGDFVDRGSFSVECIFTLFSFKLLYPDHFFMSRENGRSPSKRGVGCQFGPDVTHAFLKRNKLDYIVRSHEVKQLGYEVAHDGKCITLEYLVLSIFKDMLILTLPAYSQEAFDQMGNKGAFITTNGKDLIPKFTSFQEVPHPDVKPMAYAKLQSHLGEFRSRNILIHLCDLEMFQLKSRAAKGEDMNALTNDTITFENRSRRKVNMAIGLLFANFVGSLPEYTQLSLNLTKKNVTHVILYDVCDMSCVTKYTNTFSATSHGKGIIDGIGGRAKYLVRHKVMSKSSTPLIIQNSQDFANAANQLMEKTTNNYLQNSQKYLDLLKQTDFLYSSGSHTSSVLIWSFPADLQKLSKFLRTLDLSKNKIQNLPPNISQHKLVNKAIFVLARYSRASHSQNGKVRSGTVNLDDGVTILAPIGEVCCSVFAIVEVFEKLCK